MVHANKHNKPLVFKHFQDTSVKNHWFLKVGFQKPLFLQYTFPEIIRRPY